MTTAYTSLLGLALPVTGELSGTWGDTVNDSITSLLDTSVAGTTNVSTDADVTLTTTTGAANQARQAILLFSGARTALRTVTAPAQSKIYTVINATTGGFSVKLVGAGPTTGVTIANGARTVVAWNGSDFVELSSPNSIILPGGTANGVLYLNGSKVVTSGSALTFDGTNLSTTGRLNTGANLGLVLNNATGAYAAWQYNGTGVADVGVASQVIGGGATTDFGITSRSASGNLVFGINTSEQMRLTSTGLGLGTSSPARKLDVRGTSSSFGNFFLVDTTSGTTGTGGGVIFGSDDGAGTILSYAAIQGIKENSTAANTQGALLFVTKNSAGTQLERARLDSSGNLGLGVTPSAWDSTFVAAQLGASTTTNGNAALYSQKNGGFSSGLLTNTYYNGGWKYVTSNPATRYEQNTGSSAYFAWYTAPSGTAGNAITFTQAMTLDASGNLGVGVTSITGGYKAQINGNLLLSSTNPLIVGNSKLTLLGDNTSSTGAIIDSSGNLLVNQTTNPANGRVAISFPSGTFGTATNYTTGTGTCYFHAFNYNGGGVGSISSDGSTTSYNTTSDYRLKENIQSMQNALGVVAQLNPVTYNWKANGSKGQGFIAHELQEVVPDCVTGEKDAVDDEGKPVYQGIDTSFLVATLTAAIQEQQAIIESLKARLDAANL